MSCDINNIRDAFNALRAFRWKLVEVDRLQEWIYSQWQSMPEELGHIQCDILAAGAIKRFRMLQGLDISRFAWAHTDAVRRCVQHIVDQGLDLVAAWEDYRCDCLDDLVAERKKEESTSKDEAHAEMSHDDSEYEDSQSSSEEEEMYGCDSCEFETRRLRFLYEHKLRAHTVNDDAEDHLHGIMRLVNGHSSLPIKGNMARDYDFDDGEWPDHIDFISDIPDDFEKLQDHVAKAFSRENFLRGMARDLDERRSAGEDVDPRVNRNLSRCIMLAEMNNMKLTITLKRREHGELIRKENSSKIFASRLGDDAQLDLSRENERRASGRYGMHPLSVPRELDELVAKLGETQSCVETLQLGLNGLHGTDKASRRTGAKIQLNHARLHLKLLTKVYEGEATRDILDKMNEAWACAGSKAMFAEPLALPAVGGDRLDWRCLGHVDQARFIATMPKCLPSQHLKNYPGYLDLVGDSMKASPNFLVARLLRSLVIPKRPVLDWETMDDARKVEAVRTLDIGNVGGYPQWLRYLELVVAPVAGGGGKRSREASTPKEDGQDGRAEDEDGASRVRGKKRRRFEAGFV
ncbi:hypothetical protein JX266_008034 [Neoarthrinium moseri]|nr:hypothetical protein JX266_008034 [Neoarthrinium moseri]